MTRLASGPPARPWVSERPATPQDHARLRQRALSFTKRWDVARFSLDPIEDVEGYIAALRHPYADPEERREGRELARRWRRIVRRALRSTTAHGIQDGWVGHVPDNDPLTPPDRGGNLTRTRHRLMSNVGERYF